MSLSTSRGPRLLRAGALRSTFRATSYAYAIRVQKKHVSHLSKYRRKQELSYAMFFHFSSGSTTYPNPESAFHEPSTLPELDSRKDTHGKVCIDVPVVLLCASYVVDGFFDELAQFRVRCDFERIARRFEPFRYVRIPRKWGEMPVW